MYRAKHSRRKRSLAAPAAGIGRRAGQPDVKSLLSILSIGSAGSILSIGSAGSILCIGSTGSILRVGRDKDETDES